MNDSARSTLPKVLLIAFHFPPFKGSSGLERTLGFCRHLARFGWQPMVLGPHPRAYPAVSDERMKDIPAEVVVERAFALDTSRHLAVRKAYPGWAAVPDRWISWLLGAVPRGLRMIRRHRPRAIWSTYPIATAHIVGWALHRLTGLPWVADFRDPMVEFNHREKLWAPADAKIRRSRLWIERLCARHATRVVFCTAGALEIFVQRYPEFARERAVLIPNGFDEDAFLTAQAPAAACPAEPRRTLKMLHSGVLYPGPDRDPTQFLRAVAAFLAARPQWRGRLQIVFRATGFDSEYAPVIRSLGLEDTVELAAPVPYRQALAEMLAADVLLVFQGYTSNPAIPAKVYEYLRARRPILALLDADGDTARLLAAEHVGTVLPIEDADGILAGLGAFLDAVGNGTAAVLSEERAARFERGHRARELAALLDDCTRAEAAPGRVAAESAPARHEQSNGLPR